MAPNGHLRRLASLMSSLITTCLPVCCIFILFKKFTTSTASTRLAPSPPDVSFASSPSGSASAGQCSLQPLLSDEGKSCHPEMLQACSTVLGSWVHHAGQMQNTLSLMVFHELPEPRRSKCGLGFDATDREFRGCPAATHGRICSFNDGLHCAAKKLRHQSAIFEEGCDPR